ncbi:MAG TPA: DUF169 domain-containing protein [Candidatus Acidoferrales bacterium]|nr:DUF169 domain-containing protein [Candidatus Acidoferrales bacterium]
MESRSAAARLQSLLGLESRPVAVAFSDAPPAGLARVDAPAASGCTYWKLAAEGRAFYTEAEDHYGCPVGAHTHNVSLPPEKQKELEGLVGTMVQLQYIRMEEIPQIPQRRRPFGVASYAPLDGATFPPDAVLVRGNARAIMLLAEAASAAGAPVHEGVMGRPTCAFIPVTTEGGRAAASAGCIGNRVYTGLRDDEMYFSIPGRQLDAVVSKLEIIATANRELESFHQNRRAATQ